MSASLAPRWSLGLIVCLLVAPLSSLGSGPRRRRHPPLRFETWPSGNYGHVLLGRHAIQRFTVRNHGHRRTGALTVTMTGSDVFTLVRRANHCDSRNLRPGGLCRMTVRFDPDVLRSGSTAD